ncbi:hypothetical protein [Blastococcus sp. Marseille-P5729]|uniref:hypothetical protein n=1 Tax=Blastococcus sp. Marseille-P5729 TaxID=2086582 RepID=UPI000D114A96|nr:hypothetical protein [Blastococcus sp. Marseille-P5729]
MNVLLAPYLGLTLETSILVIGIALAIGGVSVPWRPSTREAVTEIERVLAAPTAALAGQRGGNVVVPTSSSSRRTPTEQMTGCQLRW